MRVWEYETTHDFINLYGFVLGCLYILCYTSIFRVLNRYISMIKSSSQRMFNQSSFGLIRQSAFLVWKSVVDDLIDFSQILTEDNATIWLDLFKRFPDEDLELKHRLAYCRKPNLLWSFIHCLGPISNKFNYVHNFSFMFRCNPLNIRHGIKQFYLFLTLDLSRILSQIYLVACAVT
jgi:hypothetical protein